MSRDKQIEEMTEAILYQGDNYDTCCKDDCETIASLIYTAGYRKSTELAEEIFAEIAKIASLTHGWNEPIMYAKIDFEELKELKKKYEVNKE